jgi:hypothetical protein
MTSPMSDMSPVKFGGTYQFAQEHFPPVLKPRRLRQFAQGR